jgi:hypothetical protein
MNRERFLALLADHCDNNRLLTSALRRLLGVMRSRQLKSAVVIVPSLDSHGSEVIGRILPLEWKGLINNRHLVFDDGITINLCSQANLGRGHEHAEAYLLLRPTQQLIQRVENLGNWRCLVVAAQENNAQQWRQLHTGIIDIQENEGVH